MKVVIDCMYKVLPLNSNNKRVADSPRAARGLVLRKVMKSKFHKVFRIIFFNMVGKDGL